MISVLNNWKLVLLIFFVLLILGLEAYVSYISNQLKDKTNTLKRLRHEIENKNKDGELQKKIMQRYIRYQKEQEKLRQEVEDEQRRSKEQSQDSTYTITATDNNTTK